MKNITRIRDVLVEFTLTDAHLIVLSDIQNRTYRAVEAYLDPRDQVELIKVLASNVSKLMDKRACCVCKYFDRYAYGIKCSRHSKERNECIEDNNKFFEPVEVA